MEDRGGRESSAPARADRRGAGAALAALWLISAALWLTPGLVIPDGAGYYVYLPSILLDGDLVFFDEWQRIGGIRDGVIRFKEVTATGHLGNHWASGSALFWAPGFLLGHLLRPFTGFPPDGWSLPYNVGASVVSALAGLAVLIGCWWIAMRWTTPWRAAGAAAAGWLGTNLLWYSLVNALTAHVLSAAIATAIIVIALRLRERIDATAMLIAGITGGVACAVRPQNIVLVLVPFLVAGSRENRAALLRMLPWYALGGLAGALPQLLISQVLYGSPLGFAHLGDSGPGTPFSSFTRFWGWEPLFSWYHGLFTWTPLALVAAAGFRPLWTRDRGLAAAAAWVFGASWAINATMERSFWGGFAFGQRKFDTVIPFVILALAALIAVRPRLAAIAAVPACAWTMALLFAARRGLDLNDYQTGSELFAAAARAASALGDQVGFLSGVPPTARGVVSMVAGAITIALLALVLALWRLPRRGAAALMIGYLLAASGWIALAARNDRAAIAAWRETIARNRAMGDAGGAVAMRIGLLERELAYLTRSGRRHEAERTAAELAALAARSEVNATSSP